MPIMTRPSRITAIGFRLAVLIALFSLGHAPAHAVETLPTAPRADLRLATWNLEWLIAPEDFRGLAKSCVPRGAPRGPARRSIPCNVVDRLERSSIDFRALAEVTRELKADVIALQEVDGPRAAKRVFRNHDFCFAADEGVQKVGFAIRRGLPHRCLPDFIELSLGGRVRRGAVIVLYPDDPREMYLMAVHLKASCPRRALDDPNPNCATLAKQVPILEAWIDEQAAAGRRFGILGDFNHDFSTRGPSRNEAGQLLSFWAEINDGEPQGATLINPSEGKRFINCSPAHNYSSYIDHVVLSERLAEWRAPDSFLRLPFKPKSALQRKLSDHCPVGVDLRWPSELNLGSRR
jgi:endonuclease/exonuclease/phosphatase family metal-dependent hydrolase